MTAIGMNEARGPWRNEIDRISSSSDDSHRTLPNRASCLAQWLDQVILPFNESSRCFNDRWVENIESGRLRDEASIECAHAFNGLATRYDSHVCL